MLRIAEQDEGPQVPETDLCRVLHPSYGLPSRLVLVVLGDADGVAPPAQGDDGDGPLAEITRIDAVPRFLAGRPSRGGRLRR